MRIIVPVIIIIPRFGNFVTLSSQLPFTDRESDLGYLFTVPTMDEKSSKLIQSLFPAGHPSTSAKPTVSGR